MIITWNTKKTDSGFEYRISAVGYQVPTEVLKVGNARTRAVATSMAKKWKMYFHRKMA